MQVPASHSKYTHQHLAYLCNQLMFEIPHIVYFSCLALYKCVFNGEFYIVRVSDIRVFFYRCFKKIRVFFQLGVKYFCLWEEFCMCLGKYFTSSYKKITEYINCVFYKYRCKKKLKSLRLRIDMHSLPAWSISHV